MFMLIPPRAFSIVFLSFSFNSKRCCTNASLLISGCFEMTSALENPSLSEFKKDSESFFFELSSSSSFGFLVSGAGGLCFVP